jgi:ankyrin repeat protein
LDFLANEVLKSAIDTGHVILVKTLIVRCDVDVNKRVNGRTLPSWAARSGHETVVKLLLEKGAKLETKDLSSGCTRYYGLQGIGTRR